MLKTKRTTPRRKGKPAPRIKPERVEDPAHLARVRSLPCIVCQPGNQATPTEAHHIRDGVGMGQKAGDHEAIPLCSLHHRTGFSIHGSPIAFVRMYGSERELLARTLEAMKEQEAA